MNRVFTPYKKVPNAPGKYYNRDGYVLVWVKKGQFELEHRVIAERVLGRKLKPDEEVHHIDGVRSNNSNRNLLICKRQYHSQLHHRCARVYGTWHLPSQKGDPYARSMQALKSGLPLNAANPVAPMKLPWSEYNNQPVSDTVTAAAPNGKASVRMVLSGFASIQRKR